MYKSTAFIAFLCSALLTLSAVADAQVMPKIDDLPDLVQLSDGDVNDFAKLYNELEAIGIDVDSKALGENPTVAQSVLADARAMKALESNGFTPERFQEVSYSVAMAYAAANLSDSDKQEMEAGLAQLEAMKASMPAEQWEAFQGSMGAAFQMMDQFKNQPAGNMELAEKHHDKLKPIFGDM